MLRICHRPWQHLADARDGRDEDSCDGRMQFLFGCARWRIRTQVALAVKSGCGRALAAMRHSCVQHQDMIRPSDGNVSMPVGISCAVYLERHAGQASVNSLGQPLTLVVVDVSFISCSAKKNLGQPNLRPAVRS